MSKAAYDAVCALQRALDDLVAYQEAGTVAARVLAFLRSQAAAEYRNVVMHSAASIKELESGGP